MDNININERKIKHKKRKRKIKCKMWKKALDLSVKQAYDNTVSKNNPEKYRKRTAN
jgi:hypothetical protein